MKIFTLSLNYSIIIPEICKPEIVYYIIRIRIYVDSLNNITNLFRKTNYYNLRLWL